MEKKISILGSTGSIGTQTLDIVRRNNDLRVTALAAGSNIQLLEQQIREFKPSLACVWQEEKARELKQRVRDLDVKIVSGMEGLIEAAVQQEAQMVVTAVVGMIGIRPTIAAIQAGKDIALANKETLVTAGHLIMPMAREQGVRILPVDSEHSAIFQCLQGNEDNPIHKILLTASGGPFRGWSRQQMASVQVEDALKHPNWAMGHKITIDSSTMVNKGLEVIEAKWLFGVSVDDVQVVVQPQSVIHSMVEYVDGAIIAELGTPDMKLPIRYAFAYPNPMKSQSPKLELSQYAHLTFEHPDTTKFPLLNYAYEAMRLGGNIPCILNAANEVVVDAFLKDKIGFLQMADIIADIMQQVSFIKSPSYDDYVSTDAEARRLTREKIISF